MPFVEPREIPDKPWGRELVLAEGPGYALKKLVYEPGHQGGFQLHEVRDEAFTLHEGAALVSWVDSDGAVHNQPMRPGDTFHVPTATPHKFQALERCIVYEASTGVLDDRVNVAEQYGDHDGQAR